MSAEPTNHRSAVRAALTIGALGVVFGDIGTSPLYALRECFDHLPGEVERNAGILGALSLVFWAVMIEVCIKYLLFVTRADNRGEGGVFALLALSHHEGARARKTTALTMVVMVAAELHYGDGVITPAISVLGAAEGLESFNPLFKDYVPWIACGILAVLFYFQSRGTRAIGRVFGPGMIVWFSTLGLLGIWHIIKAPQIFAALNPMYGLRLLFEHPADAAGLLGAVVLVFTGAEALYADMGHFGRKSIARAWLFVAFPGLFLNYFGQGAWALTHTVGEGVNPFFALVPEGLPRLLLTALSIMAAIIASQAMISGTYSLTRQAIQLGYFPRLQVKHTNAELSGQIYLPLVNTFLAVGSILVVLQFGSSKNLAAAYGIAVTGTMVVTTIAFFTVARQRWRWSPLKMWPLLIAFLCFDLAFFGANIPKIPHGGWFPIAVAIAMIAIMYTWKKGKSEIFRRVYANEITEDELRDIARSKHVSRVKGTGVFMAGNPQGTPLVLLHHVKANKVLHETVILLSIMTEDVPYVSAENRLEVREIGEGTWRSIGRYGYMESPDVSKLIEQIREAGVPLKPNEATYYFNREMIITGGASSMWEWQKHFYAFLSRNARQARDYYHLPPMQIIEVGLPVQL